MTADSKKIKGRLMLVDPSLKGPIGCHYALAKAIVEAAMNDGVEVVIFSNQVADDLLQVAGAKIVPVFSMTTDEYYEFFQKKSKLSLKKKIHMAFSLRSPESIKIILRKMRSRLQAILAKAGVLIDSSLSGRGDMSDELLAAMLKVKVTSNDHVVIHSADAIAYRLVLKLLLNKYPLGEYPCFHICTPYEIPEMPHVVGGMAVDRVVNYLKLMGLLNNVVYLYAENELLAGSLTRSWGVEVNSVDVFNIHLSLGNEGQKHQNSVKITARDDSCFENKYNGALREAVVSDDGKVLFLKQI